MATGRPSILALLLALACSGCGVVHLAARPTAAVETNRLPKGDLDALSTNAPSPHPDRLPGGLLLTVVVVAGEARPAPGELGAALYIRITPPGHSPYHGAAGNGAALSR